MPEMPQEGQAGEPPKKKKKQKEEKKDDRSIHFRNYQPRTAELRDQMLPRITSADIEDEIDKEIADAIEAAEDTEAVLAIAPKKPNWDLKRDVERKMSNLSARTDRAVVQLIRQRIKKDKAPELNGAANPEDERSARDEASMALAREVGKAGAPKGGDSDDEGA
mmetsp:Transcript_91138/g.162245  ORF Transcript_91138/g.162245 Transcript_91138/m.162245 type:complete len:164 (+) Transcript_91138:79-570(+)|eukprot:CAMPEP_0197659000 /NCGR_PEP_ID=MMETSP1338-20131121/45765_1 /TAXON_ID=43686 ORGANISM="Pelagodinium beii, Strain RCC1491" /NCGR_SAMPLE_ID=MMETSP1338 /ASSEMBLY_ACC=CAM_ASM_000754 /LENGTH=163 /DNA_ID=CAMNT_0043235725 /DNA_START=68 /DNA_END=559 /DNA_ORIENTATION=+